VHTQCCIPLPWPGRLPGGQMCWRAAGPATSGERGCQFSAHGASRCSPAPHARSRAACRRRQNPCSRTRHAAAGRASPAALEPTSTGSQIAAGPPPLLPPRRRKGGSRSAAQAVARATAEGSGGKRQPHPLTAAAGQQGTRSAAPRTARGHRSQARAGQKMGLKNCAPGARNCTRTVCGTRPPRPESRSPAPANPRPSPPGPPPSGRAAP